MIGITIDKTPRYNLSYVMKETGIKADTLRAWERRYKLPQPTRSEGGHRLFSDYDLEMIKWLILKQEEGMRISKAVELFQELESEGRSPITPLHANKGGISPPLPAVKDIGSLVDFKNAWITACLEFDEIKADQMINRAFAQFPVENVCTEILQASLSEIGTLWFEGNANVQQEHFASELAIRRLHSLISASPNPIRNQTILVGCPRGEDHTFSSLLITLLLRYRGWNVVNLGANVPNEKLLETIFKIKPDLVVLTAMRIVTAAALLEAAIDLHKHRVPLAFGGGVFDQIPSLSKRIPGFFLGHKITNAVGEIEKLLSEPLPRIEPLEIPQNLIELAASFIEQKPFIEIKVDQTLKETRSLDFSSQDLSFIHDFLSQDIVSALHLGDIKYIGTSIDWVRRLLIHRSVQESLLDAFLSAYLESVKDYLGEDGQPIIKWMETWSSQSQLQREN